MHCVRHACQGGSDLDVEAVHALIVSDLDLDNGLRNKSLGWSRNALTSIA